MIGVLTIEAIIYDAQSLKEKRGVLKSVITRLRDRLNISVSETGHQNVWQRTEITIASVSSDRTRVEQELNRALHFIDSVPEIETASVQWEWF
ncbi:MULTISPECIES: DUF503 domain-containing protein [Alteribacter]|uniref:DUF503 domain-containing protein n=1 Tax=Alteribacter keqinensis TaxID=2483800 RepID=A0A3M7TWA9_9BACI|nr:MULTISPECIES: DUF503 domain-containing protein [Alteribacter]MBM7094218.1 DUF503 domain-containing protein [Alteribacter salitolerans]RNA69549.1 DUF503 domain-containing protein [Alteribacter keqinensis]